MDKKYLRHNLKSLSLIKIFLPIATVIIGHNGKAESINFAHCKLEESIVGNYKNEKTPQASFEGSVSLQKQEQYGEVGFINLINANSNGIKGQFKVFDRLIITYAQSRNLLSIAGVNIDREATLPQVVNQASPQGEAQFSITTRQNDTLTNFYASCKLKKSDSLVEEDLAGDSQSTGHKDSSQKSVPSFRKKDASLGKSKSTSTSQSKEKTSKEASPGKAEVKPAKSTKPNSQDGKSPVSQTNSNPKKSSDSAPKTTESSPSSKSGKTSNKKLTLPANPDVKDAEIVD